ncbi:uncharacterized protein METZ01_LOCUS183967, partial [marine metagenome]
VFFGSSKTEEEKRNIKFHNLDMITSVDYYVKSKTATQFCIWVSNTLRDRFVE